MGGDGGSIPTRRCLVPDKKKIHKENPTDARRSQNNYCQLSATRLKKPVLCSKLGKLYNKDAVLNHLIDNKNKVLKPGEVDKLPEIKKIRIDAYELNLTDNTNYKREEETALVETKAFPFICTVTGYEMNGAQNFVFGSVCRNVVSEKALKMANSQFFPKSQSFDPLTTLHYIYQDKYEGKLVCPITNTKFGRVLQINPQTELEIRRANAFAPKHKVKKVKSGKRTAIEAGEATDKISERHEVATNFRSGLKNTVVHREAFGGQTFDNVKKIKIDQKLRTSEIKMPSILHMTKSVTGDVNETEIEKYRKLNLIGDTTKSEDKSALGQMFTCSRPWQH
jgi:hypothetical protein